ncbi:MULTISPECIES: RrF2 family transcriptional regulator [Stappia]|uniref:Rrf2 family transcriptional regulator n=1 Tax=Stappia taiwanensis TaxID=992267 RepID=A0A838XZ82_9HYPH|nr:MULTISPECIES: Rrf2 family transcriptional regulator [Stappia]MBA4612060.1 Rrf2 family transcriptional regulator [Stappia taiwanensis]MCA1297717.1 Rrf2 family transcriptional regulator [Stappia indica]GGE91393.1 Rrf2 family transcriptional regulator [Stappia taiwanensis]
MRLNQASDFALRILMRLGQVDEPQTIDTLSRTLGLAKSHVMKLVARLAQAGLVETTRGRGGGVRLLRPPSEIRAGAVVRLMEQDLAVVACLREGPCACSFLPLCALKGAMAEAAEAFLDSLDRWTLEDLLKGTQPARSLERLAP